MTDKLYTQAEVDMRVQAYKEMVQDAVKQAITSAEEATVLACADAILPFIGGSMVAGIVSMINGVLDMARKDIRALLKTPGQLARYVEQAAKPLVEAAEEATVLACMEHLRCKCSPLCDANHPVNHRTTLTTLLKTPGQLARREDEIRRQEAQWWDTYIDEHLEKYGKEWRRKRGKERLAELSQPSAPPTAASDATNE